MAYPSTYPASRCSPSDTDTQLALWGGWSHLHRDTASQLKRQRKWGLSCKGTSCLRRSFDESKRCTQHPKLANLLVELERTQR